MEVKVLIRNEEGRALAVTCRICGKFTLDTQDFLCASCTLDHFMRSFFAPTVRHTEQDDVINEVPSKEDKDHVSKS